MSKMLFINLPVSNLDTSTRFYEALGARKNPQFSNENAACMMLTDTIGVMILTHDLIPTRRRITASCGAARWRIRTGMSGRSSGWTRRLQPATPRVSTPERDVVG